jgi:formate-dependent nitrite reductase membrane component NrfD
MSLKLPRFADERYLEHRRRSTSLAGVVTILLVLVLFEVHLLRDHRWSWELFSALATFMVVKFTAFFYYRLRD